MVVIIRATLQKVLTTTVATRATKTSTTMINTMTKAALLLRNSLNMAQITVTRKSRLQTWPYTELTVA